MKKGILLSIVFVFSFPALADSLVLFQSNSNYMEGTRHAKNQYFRIPSLVTINKSQYVVAFAEERLGSNSDTGDINVVYRYSKDHGKTWSPIYRLCDLGRNVCGNPTAVVDQDTQEVHIFMNGNDGRKGQFHKNPSDRFGVNDRWILYAKGRFKRGHLSFGEIEDYTGVFNPGRFKMDMVGPGTGIQLTRGPYKGRLVVPALRRTFYKDPGEDWKVSPVTESKMGTETAIAEMKNGHIVRSDRMHGAQPGAIRRITSFSDDGGESFHEHAKDPKLLDPRCQGSLLTYTPSRIVHANCASTKGRRYLLLRVSRDGENWHDFKRINNDCGYSSMAKTRDYRVGILWEKKAKNFKNPKVKDIVFDKYSLRDLGFD